MDLLSCERFMFKSVRAVIKSIFETGNGGSRYYVVW